MDDQITFADGAIQHCPFPTYDRLRAERPVFHDPKTGHYVLTRYDDVRKATMSPSILSNKMPFLGNRWTPEANAMFEREGWLPIDTLVSNDPPDHKFYRRFVDRVFTTKKVEDIEARIDEIVNELIDAFIKRDEIDFLADSAGPLPMYVIAEQLGVQSGDYGKFKEWSNAAVESTGPIKPERELELARVIIDMQQYMAHQIERVRATPGDLLLSRLVNLEEGGRRLTDRELQNMLLVILVAGNENDHHDAGIRHENSNRTSGTGIADPRRPFAREEAR